MDKQNQIEVIETEYKEWAVNLLKVRFDLKPEAFDEHHKNNYSFENCADCLWNKIKGSIEELLWLRENQLHENAVVVPDMAGKDFYAVEKAEWDKMVQGAKDIIHEREEKTRKETAEKFAEKLKEYLCDKSILEFGSDDTYVITASLDECYGKIDEICNKLTEGEKC